jgi:EAL domain-containing protein (putative c-di-GMP-specific phosphodiesterase class I)
LRAFPVQSLKIDRSFIRDLGVDPRTTSLIQMIITIGQALGFDVVAEGVETALQLAQLREMGCRSAQGFWFTKAVDAAAAAQLLGHSLPICAASPRVDDAESAANTGPPDIDRIT